MGTKPVQDESSSPPKVTELVQQLPSEKEISQDAATEEKQGTRSIQDDSQSESTTIVDAEPAPAEANVEQVQSTKQPLVKVPRAKKRGLFARFAAIPEVTEPYHYPNKTKWLITFIVAIAAAAAPVGSAIVLPTLGQISRDFNTSPTLTNLSVALYMLSMAIFPLWWSAFSETLGRRTIYIVSFAMFAVFGVLSAVSKSIAMLIVMRMLNGGASASVQAVGAGTIADLWEPCERGRAMGIFYLGPLLGPLLAPLIGGGLGEALGWRATQWAIAIYGLVIWLMIFFALPETLRARKDVAAVAAVEEDANPSRPTLTRTTTAQSVKKKSKQYARIIRMLFLDPLMVLGYLRFPLVLLCVYYSAVTFGSLYVLNISVQYSFERSPYNFSTVIIGLLYVPNSLGYILASLFGGRWMDRIMIREARSRREKQPTDLGPLVLLPEDRMRENAWLGALIYPAALIAYGWTVEKGVIWIVPMIANFFYGIGSMLIFAMATTMLTEFMPKRSSSGVAVNNFVRNILSCIGAIVGAPIIASIGNGWLFTILGLWALSSCTVIWAVRRFGPRWRKGMNVALD